MTTTAQTLPAWVQRIGEPLPDAPCGEDPRYRDEFLFAKEEIDKLQHVDYAAVLKSCQGLLTEVTKDLRVAGYQLLAATYVDGHDGLFQALAAYRLLVTRFWDTCYPRSDSARQAALALLNNPRLVAFAEQHTTGGDDALLAAIQAETEQINTLLVAQLGEETPRLTALAAWADGMVRKTKPTVDANPGDGVAASAASSAALPPKEITSEHDLGAMTRQLHTHLISTGCLLRALAFSRAYRWGNLTLPPHDNGQTRIPEPRSSGWAELQQAVAAGVPESALHCCETLFFEPGFHLAFDLQWQAHQQALAMDRPDLAQYIQNALRDLLQRLPQLIDLHFADGTPLAGTQCRQWLQQWQAETASAVSAPAQGEEEASAAEATRELMAEALQLTGKKQLPAALECLQAWPAHSESQRVRKRLAEAQLCLAGGKAALAEALLEEVQEQALAQHLPLWNPALAVEILRQRTTALQALQRTAAQEDKLRIAQQLHQVQLQLCRIDVAAAARGV